MKTIGIADFKKLVMERLANPRDYAGRSLVLWNADYMDYGIAYRVIEQCCERYNEENPNDQVWFHQSDMCFTDEDYTKPETIRTWYVRDENTQEYHMETEVCRCGILFNTGCYMLYEQEEWLNTHTNQNGGIFQDCAVIVCAQADQLDPQWILKEEQFGNNCDIYSIQPTLDEWTKWAESFYDAEIIKIVRAYIEKNGVIKHFDWWMRIMKELNNLKKNYSEKERKDCHLWQIPERRVSLNIGGAVGEGHPVPDFCKFIYEYNSVD